MWTIAISLLLGYGIGTLIAETIDFFDEPEDDDAVPIGDEATDTDGLDDLLDTPDETADDVAAGDDASEPATISGSEAADTFSYDDDAAYADDLVLNAGGGDDSIVLTDPEGSTSDADPENFLSGIEVNGDNGDDIILVKAAESTISGGSGDDTITVFSPVGTSTFGDGGNDTLTGVDGAGDPAALFGGEGDDFVDGREMVNAELYGGAGDDTILTSAQPRGGTGYNVAAYGGDGDDLLIHEARPQSEGATLLQLHGGAGTDTFNVSLDESYDDSWEGERPLESTVVRIVDFEPDAETVQVRLDIDDPSYAIGAATLDVVTFQDFDSETQEFFANQRTDLTISYESETGGPREMTIQIDGTGLDWDDIAFIGDNQPAVLIPIAIPT